MILVILLPIYCCSTCWPVFFKGNYKYRAQKSPVWMLFLRDKSLFKLLICPVVKGSNNQEKCQSWVACPKVTLEFKVFLALPMASIYSFVSFLSRPDIFKKHTSSALTKKFAIVVNYEMLYFGYKLWANNLYSLIKY